MIFNPQPTTEIIMGEREREGEKKEIRPKLINIFNNEIFIFVKLQIVFVTTDSGFFSR